MIEICDDDELLLAKARFRALVGEWDVGPSKVAALLGLDRDDLGLDLVPRAADADSEQRLRLLLRIRDLLPTIAPDVRDVPVVLRDVDPSGPVNDNGEPLGSLLEFMTGPTEHLRSVIAALSVKHL